jgi:hypothetical protein
MKEKLELIVNFDVLVRQPIGTGGVQLFSAGKLVCKDKSRGYYLVTPMLSAVGIGFYPTDVETIEKGDSFVVITLKK